MWIGHAATLVLLCWPLLILAREDAFDWPRFRGPDGSGVSDARDLPVVFGPARNVAWKTQLPPGNSSPVLTRDRIYLTAYEGSNLEIICLDRRNGQILWRKTVDKARAERRSAMNDSASSTPLTDGDNVYAFFSEFGIVSYAPDGKERWRMPLGPFSAPHGMATSPILAEGRIVLVADQVEGSHIAAFDAGNGRVRWKTERANFVGGYTTPIAHKREDGSTEVLVAGPFELISYSAATGKKIWWAGGMGIMPIASPSPGPQAVYLCNDSVPPFEALALDFKADKDHDGKLTPEEFPDPAFREAVLTIDRVFGNGDGAIDQKEWDGGLKLGQGTKALVAVEYGGTGDVTQSHVRWRATKGLPDVASPLLYRDLLYLVKNGGVLTSLDPDRGTVIKEGRLKEAVDKYFASPVAADGKIFLVSESGKVTVLKAGRDWEILSVNDLGEDCYATPAIGENAIYIRTRTALYCFSTGGRP